MAAFPWQTIDSSSWLAGWRYGRIYLWDDSVARFRIVHRERGRSGAWIGNYTHLFREHHTDPAVFQAEGFARAAEGKTKEQLDGEGAAMLRIEVTAWQRCEAWLQRRWATPGRPRIYLAAGNWLMITRLLQRPA